MPTKYASSRRILNYGRDEILLRTRKAVLESVGFACDTARTAEEFLECITASPRGYDIFILCHSVPAIEQEIFVEAAKGSGVAIYTLNDMVAPPRFIENVRRLAAMC